ncbi:MAG: NAD(P)H-dependent glycerol-3-phosphate dehydrogenase [Burkholderiales bacterium]
MTTPSPLPPLSILGAGAWGTALAIQLARRAAAVCLWARDPAQAESMSKEGCNAAYLPGFALPPGLQITPDFDHAVRHAENGLLMVATPMAGLADILIRLQAGSSRGSYSQVLWLCKGFQENTAALGHEVARALAPSLRVGVLSGPSFAQEVARGQPTALVVASHDAALRESAAACLHGGSLRVYTSADPVGVEVGGAVKNVLAIATGIADGFCWPQAALADGRWGLGLNARAALITRGLAEMTRLGLALGAQPSTFMGLSGLGDLVLTSTGDLSRNRQVGLGLAQGKPLEKILADLGHVAEGVRSAPMVLQRAQACGVDMPITRAVVRVLWAEQNVAQALEELLGRKAGSETDFD